MRITKLWVIVMLVAFQLWSCYGCLEEERIALLQFKASVDHLHPDSLSDWVEGSDCCNWTCVYCNDITGRVTQLELDGVTKSIDWHMNVSLFLPFKEIRTLFLSENGIVGCVENEGFEKLSVVTNLEYLTLDDNYLDDTIWSCLSAFSSLKSLSLRANKIKAPKGFERLSVLTNLEYLYLDNNYLDDTILSSLRTFSSLKRLSLDWNKIKGPISIEGLNNLTSLQELSLGGNGIHGFDGEEQILKLKNLESLDLSNNLFDHSILSHLSSFPSLTFLDLSNNRLKGSINVTGYSNITNSFLILETIGRMHSLTSLLLSNCGLSGIISTPTQGLCQLKNLEMLRMNDNNLNGELPSCLTNLTSLFFLDISNNSLYGRIPERMSNLSTLEYLDLSQNHFSGVLPNNFNFPSLNYLSLSANNLEGSFVQVFHKHSKLNALDLSHNNFTDSIPSSIGLLSFLYFLFLSYNNLHGEIPMELCKLNQLSFIDLSNNNFSGHIQPCITSSVSQRIGAVETRFIDQHPLLTTKNKSYIYHGTVLLYLYGVDLSCNNLDGEIPREFGNLSFIQVLNLSHNSLIGEIPPTFSNLREIETLDLSFNNLNGSIPPQLTGLNSLSSFNVAHNNLSGRTPGRVAQFGTFQEISYKDNPYLSC